MRNTRTSSFKSKFKNTQATTLNLDEDDDDFVTPQLLNVTEADPVPINVDTSIQTKVRRNYRTRSTPVKENISTQHTEGGGSGQNDMNIVGSSKTKKQKKKTSKVEHGKNNVECDFNKDKKGTIQIVSTSVRGLKRKGSDRNTPVKDKKKSSDASGERKKSRGLNDIFMERVSGSKKNSENANIGVDMEDMEDVVETKKVVQDAYSKESTKRKKGNLEHENDKKKTMEGKVRKISKEHPEGYRRLATRMTPGSISSAMKVMSPT
ncbi:unnamed protein product [Lactuca saligna]|uniref:Uncharacterized protein n=1 Tax=Lactuca saligna TaxID=75948 RepID=A0AA36A4M2_LACSI|nr:unnamed protein product [Lactuca saligna]